MSQIDSDYDSDAACDSLRAEHCAVDVPVDCLHRWKGGEEGNLKSRGRGSRVEGRGSARDLFFPDTCRLAVQVCSCAPALATKAAGIDVLGHVIDARGDKRGGNGQCALFERLCTRGAYLGPRVEGRGSRLRVEGRGSRVEGRGSRVEGRGSR
eukprot:419434-Rhodomonas_salina.1